jgi:tetratricopeptide (TPR) repeat protein
VGKGMMLKSKALENGKKQLAKGQGMCGYYPQAYDRLNLVIRYAPDPVWTARVYATLGLTLLYMERDEEAVLYFERAKNIKRAKES